MNPKNCPPSRLTESGAALITMITKMSQTFDGFNFSDATHITTNMNAIATRTGRMVTAGLLHRSKVPGHHVCFHATPELSAAWIAATPSALARPKPRIYKPRANSETLSKRQKGKLLLAEILRCAALPDGFSISNAPPEIAKTSAWGRCQELVKAGEIVSIVADYGIKHYFTTQEAADKFREVFLVRSKNRATERVARNAYKPKSVAIVRKPYVPPKPKVDAEIVHTAQTRYVIAQTPPQRFVAFERPSFVHGGMSAMR